MGELIYSFAAIASRYKNEKTSLLGMQRLAETLHPHGVPITWLVSVDSARAAAKELNAWHDRYGDDVAVAPSELSLAPVSTEGTYEQRRDRLAGIRESIQKVLPWAECRIASGHTDPEIVKICQDLGFEGLWGFCWEQIEVDQITDRGCPWGFYYMNPEDRLRPADGRGVVAVEWTARDLLKSYHSGNPCLYSTDPNDVARGSICAWDNIDYWKALADNYIRNTRYNEQVFLLQHQEAHETEIADGWRCYTEEDIRESLIMLDRFVAHIKPHARMMTVADAVRTYRDQNEKTASSYMLWENSPTPTPNPDFAWNTCPGPWPRTFLHYDRGAQMMFVDGQVQPVCIRNYSKPWDTQDFYAETHIPRPRLIQNVQYTWSREIHIEVDSPKAMPYGFALWGDYCLYQIAEAPGLVEGKILPRELLFLRYNLQPGTNRFVVKLQGK